jgi:LAO/AO transport system kinase
MVLGKVITLLESLRPDRRALGRSVLEACLPATGQAVRIGITGPPGVGKSTFVEAYGSWLLEQGIRRLAVLAVDPSSQLSGGSILGDKTRMAGLSADDRVFIRPSPAGSSLGGVSHATREVALLCEAAGYDRILIETVGVGQSEVSVHSMVDCLLLLLLPAGGDELQGMKRGIVELADLIAINKADGPLQAIARQTARQYAGALHLFPPKADGWSPVVSTCSARTGEGIDVLGRQLEDCLRHGRATGWLQRRRTAQNRYWMRHLLEKGLQELLLSAPVLGAQFRQLEQDVSEGRMTPAAAAAALLGQLTLRPSDPG